jgi:hypothetical protein
MQTTNKTSLPFKQLTPKEQEADILPHLQQSLMSIHKMLDKGYTTIFLLGNEGVTIHEPDTLNITMNKPPVLQGCKEEGQKLWTIATSEEEDEINNIYNLPLAKQSIRYLHAVAGFPVESTWMEAIKAENYVTLLRLTPEIARKHFPESDKVQKEHMKQQRRNIQCTKIKIEPDGEPIPDLRIHADIKKNIANPDTVKKISTKELKLKDIYIHIINTDNTMYTNQPGCFPATSSVSIYVVRKIL